MKGRRALVDWVCRDCGHHNPIGRMACRKCRNPRPLGSAK